MMLVALQTLHGRKLIKEANPRDPRSRAKYEDMIAAPGIDIDTEVWGIGDDEANGLIARGAARRKVREVPVDAPAPAAPAANAPQA